ncbi:MAG: SagB/ThcOx family dehydrogenase [Chloroflexota bacterium]
MTDAGVGDKFQEATKYERGELRGGRLDWASKPAAYKSYPEAAKVELGDPDREGGLPLWDVLQERRSERHFLDVPLNRADLSQLLWAAQGITRKGGSVELRTAPSAGALYPVETYVVVHEVEGIDPGVYHYDVRHHRLELLRQGDFRTETARAALDQRMAAQANAVFVWTALFRRSKWKYKQRAYRYVYLDAGHIAQNLALAAVALDLGSCQVAALYDDEANELLGVDGEEESTIYMTVVGRPG